MHSNRLVIAVTSMVVLLFFISPVIACNFPGPNGSTVTGTIYASDGKTPLKGANVVIENGSSGKSYQSGSTDEQGHYHFSGEDNVAGLTYMIHASYNGDQVSADCTDQEHSADSGTFTLSDGQTLTMDVTIPGVSVSSGGDPTTPCPTSKPEPPVKPVIPKGNHSSYPPMAAGDSPGTIAGVVLSNESSDPFCGAYVAVVSATGANVEYSCTYTDCNGFFQFYGVNSTTDAVYKLFVTDGCGNTAYSDPFKVGSGESVKVNMNLGKKESPPDTPATPTPSIEPTTTPPIDNATALSAESAQAMDQKLDASVPQSDPGIIGQITGFFGSIVSNIFSI